MYSFRFERWSLVCSVVRWLGICTIDAIIFLAVKYYINVKLTLFFLQLACPTQRNEIGYAENMEKKLGQRWQMHFRSWKGGIYFVRYSKSNLCYKNFVITSAVIRQGFRSWMRMLLELYLKFLCGRLQTSMNQLVKVTRKFWERYMFDSNFAQLVGRQMNDNLDEMYLFINTCSENQRISVKGCCKCILVLI